jgi:hypothetical protein
MNKRWFKVGDLVRMMPRFGGSGSQYIGIIVEVKSQFEIKVHWFFNNRILFHNSGVLKIAK